MTLLSQARLSVPDLNSPFVSLARTTGLLYLLVAICGGFAQVVRTSLVQSGDAEGTAENILDSYLLFRIGFSSDLVAFCSEIFLAVAIYFLFRSVSDPLALIASFFRMAQATVLGLNMLNQFLAGFLLDSRQNFAAFSEDQLAALSLLFMEAHEYGYLIGLIFFGLSSIALGYVVIKSGFLPKIFGVTLMSFVGLGYIADSFTTFLMNDKPDWLSIVLIGPAAISELVFILWLVIKGASPSNSLLEAKQST